MKFEELGIGDAVLIQKRKRGIVRYLGRTKFAGGDWVGIELEEATGRHNGTVEGYYYFSAPINMGLFVRATSIEFYSEEVRRMASIRNAQRSPTKTPSKLQLNHTREELNDEEVDAADLDRLLDYSRAGEESMFVSPQKRLALLSEADLKQNAVTIVQENPPKDEQHLFVWGENKHGELGVGSEEDQRFPKQVQLPRDRPMFQVKFSENNLVCVNEKYEVYTCGSWVTGLLGQGPNSRKKSKKISEA